MAHEHQGRYQTQSYAECFHVFPLACNGLAGTGIRNTSEQERAGGQEHAAVMFMAACVLMGIFDCPCCTNTRYVSSKLLKKSFYTGCSKMRRCKARNIMRNEAYYCVRRKDE